MQKSVHCSNELSLGQSFQVELFTYQVESEAEKTLRRDTTHPEEDSNANTTDGDLFDIVRNAERPGRDSQEQRNIPMKKVSITML